MSDYSDIKTLLANIEEKYTRSYPVVLGVLSQIAKKNWDPDAKVEYPLLFKEGTCKVTLKAAFPEKIFPKEQVEVLFQKLKYLVRRDMSMNLLQVINPHRGLVQIEWRAVFENVPTNQTAQALRRARILGRYWEDVFEKPYTLVPTSSMKALPPGR